MWVNIDKPTKKVTLHEERCLYVPTEDSEYKKIGRFGRDGGWFKFKNREEILRFYEENFSDFERGYCFNCGSETRTSINEPELFYNQISEKELQELRESTGNLPWDFKKIR